MSTSPIPLWQVLKDEYESFHQQPPEVYVKDVAILATAIKVAGLKTAPEGPQTELSKYIYTRLPGGALKASFDAWGVEESLPDELRRSLNGFFYGLLSDRGLATHADAGQLATALEGAGLKQRTLAELQQTKLLPGEVYQVNGRLLELAYPGLVGRIDWEANATDEERLRWMHAIIHQRRHSALCLSGGGIRSGTFALGVIQSLARRGLLTQFDYLSTVSGGGYIGGWLTAWIHRHGRGIEGVVDDLNGASRTSSIKPEPAPLQYLREYSNFITPRSGLLSADTWTFVGIYVRNLLLNWVVLIPLLASVLMIPRVANAGTLAPQSWRVLLGMVLLGGFGLLLLNATKKTKWVLLVLGVASLLFIWFHWWGDTETTPKGVADIEGALLAAGTLLGGYTLAYMRLSRPSNAGAVRPGSLWDRRRDQGGFLWLCLLPLTVSASLLTIFWAWFRRTMGLSTENPIQCVSLFGWDEASQSAKCLRLFDWFGWRGWQVGEFGGFLIYGFLLGLTGWFLYVVLAGTSWWGGRQEIWGTLKEKRGRWELLAGVFWNALRELLVTLLASVLGSILLYVAATKIPIFYDPVVNSSDSVNYSTELYTWLAFPTYLFVFFLGITLFIGFTSRRSEKSLPQRRRSAAAARGLFGRVWNWLRHPFDAAYVEDEDREWLARASAWVFIVMGGWVFLGGLVIFGPLLYFKLGNWLAGIGGVSGLIAYLGGRSSRTPGAKKDEAGQAWWKTLGVNMLIVAAFIFFSCIVIAIALLSGTVIAWLAKYFSPELAHTLDMSPQSLAAFAEHYPFESTENVFRVLHFPSWLYLLALALGLQLFGRLSARLINLNKFSLHAGYRDRIIRAFLGASRLRGERQANPFTGFDPRDDLHMAELRPLLLRESDFEPGGLEQFAAALNQPAPGVASLLRKGIEEIKGESRKYFRNPPYTVEFNPSFRTALFGDLNTILQEYDIPSAGEPQTLRPAPEGSDSEARIRRNRQLLKEAFDYIKDPPPPYRLLHVVNMALNLVGGDQLAWQSRRAESFTSSALHSGSLFVGYRHTHEYGGKNGIKLGTAVAVSGAAVNSNMGYVTTSPLLTFVLTFFNARLGWWLGNPGRHGADTYYRSHPQNALSPIIDEAFGLTNDRNPYVLLSDGGHFENLGLYEMVMRRCHNIVVADGSADPTGVFSDLGAAVRKIRIDFGIDIKFDQPFTIYPRPESLDDEKKSEKGGYVAIGRIHYEDVDGNNPLGITSGDTNDLTGTLVYIKPAFYGQLEPRDIYNYAKSFPDFPHESTADQFFDEPQFESHRMLGFFILQKLIADASKGTAAPGDVEQLVEMLEKKAVSDAAQGVKEKQAGGDAGEALIDALRQLIDKKQPGGGGAPKA